MTGAPSTLLPRNGHAGMIALEQRLRRSDQLVPVGLGQRGGTYGDQLIVNESFVRLVAQARQYAVDVAAWLPAHGPSSTHADGCGMWIEAG